MSGNKSSGKYEKVETSGEDLEAGKAVEGSALFVVKVKSPDDKIHEINLESDATVETLKQKIHLLTDVEPERQRLIYFGKMLNDNSRKITEYQVSSGDFIHLVPKPKNVIASAETGSVGDLEGVVSNPGNLFRRSSIRSGEPGRISSADYFQRLELGLWRARVRLLSSLMLFYYFLQLMTNLSFWLHPEELSARFVTHHEPSTLFFTLDLVEAILGIKCALLGVKSAASESTSVHANNNSVELSRQFLVSVLHTCLFHFLAFSVWTKEIINGQILMKPAFRYHGNSHDDSSSDFTDDSEQNGVNLMFSIAVNLGLWFGIVIIAARFYKHTMIVFPEQVMITDTVSVQSINLDVEEPDDDSQPDQENITVVTDSQEAQLPNSSHTDNHRPVDSARRNVDAL